MYYSVYEDTSRISMYTESWKDLGTSILFTIGGATWCFYSDFGLQFNVYSTAEFAGLSSSCYINVKQTISSFCVNTITAKATHKHFI